MVTTIIPAWSVGEELLALFHRGDLPADVDGAPVRLPRWQTDGAVDHGPADAPELPERCAVRFDARSLPDDAGAVFAGLRLAGHPVWLSHVDDAETLAGARESMPDALSGQFWQVSATPSASADHTILLRLLGLLNADAENKDIEHALSGSPHLLFGLLRLVNSVAVAGGRQRITSIGHAITMLGRRQLQRWVMLLLYAERYDGNDLFSPLLVMTCARARLMEGLCRAAEGALRRQADTAFMVGMLSFLDKVLGEPMEALLARVSLPAEGEAALLRGEGPLAPVLALAMAGEAEDVEAVSAGLAALGLAETDWAERSLAAWGWLERLRESG